MKPYHEYKPSGIAWLGNIPSHWDIKKLKHVVDQFVAGSTPDTSDPSLWDDKNGTPWVTIGDMSGNEFVSRTSRKVSTKGINHGRMAVLPFGTVIYSMYASIGYASILTMDALTNQAIIGLTGVKLHINRYLMTYLNGIRDNVLMLAASNTQDNINAEKVRNILVICPPIMEQQAIAHYLDTEIARIDELIREKEDLIDLLNEAKSSLLSELITGDLLPGKLSGNDWIPHLPTGWQLKKLKHLGQIRSGLAKGKNIEDKQALELPYLRVANVQDGYLDLSEVLTIPVEIDAVERYSLKPGDVLMNEGGDYDKLGRGAVWNGEINPCLHQNHVFAIRPYYADCSEWLAAITQTRYAKFYFMNNAKQSTNLASISQSNLKELPVLWPPAAERKRILKALKEAKGELDELITHTRDEIKLLRELRAATIADAVLGRIDVRDAGRDATAVSQSAPPGLPSVAS